MRDFGTSPWQLSDKRQWPRAREGAVVPETRAGAAAQNAIARESVPHCTQPEKSREQCGVAIVGSPHSGSAAQDRGPGPTEAILNGRSPRTKQRREVHRRHLCISKIGPRAAEGLALTLLQRQSADNVPNMQLHGWPRAPRHSSKARRGHPMTSTGSVEVPFARLAGPPNPFDGRAPWQQCSPNIERFSSPRRM